jgi:hypothetical protein
LNAEEEVLEVSVLANMAAVRICVEHEEEYEVRLCYGCQQNMKMNENSKTSGAVFIFIRDELT